MYDQFGADGPQGFGGGAGGPFGGGVHIHTQQALMDLVTLEI